MQKPAAPSMDTRTPAVASTPLLPLEAALLGISPSTGATSGATTSCCLLPYNEEARLRSLQELGDLTYPEPRFDSIVRQVCAGGGTHLTASHGQSGFRELTDTFWGELGKVAVQGSGLEVVQATCTDLLRFAGGGRRWQLDLVSCLL